MFERLIDTIGDQSVLALGGFFVGVLFGAFAQYSRFCLRAATLEVAHGVVGERMAVWLFTFSTALIVTQALILLDLFAFDRRHEPFYERAQAAQKEKEPTP